ELGNSEDAAAGDVADVAASEERQHVMLAEAVDLDVLADDHAVGPLREDRAVDQFFCIGLVAGSEEAQRLGHPAGRALETFSGGILSEVHEDLADELLELFFFHGRLARRAVAPDYPIALLGGVRA